MEEGRNDLKKDILNKYKKYGLKEDDLNDAFLSFEDYLLDEVNKRNEVIDVLCNAIKNGTPKNDPEILRVISEFKLQIA